MPDAPQRTDLYPSRTGDRARILPRRDPVLHAGCEAQGPLSPEQLRAFERDGFLFLEGLFDRETTSAALEEVRRRCAGDDERVVREPDSRVVRSVFDVHRGDGALAGMARDPRLAGAARQVLGGEVYVHQSRVNVKAPLHGEGFYWHSDFETWHVEDGMPRMRAVSASIALTPTTPLNGPLLLVPGSQHAFIACEGTTPPGHYRTSLRRQQLGIPADPLLTRLTREHGISAPTGRAGSVLLFDCNTLHGSFENITPDPRTSAFFVFNSLCNRLQPPFAGTAPRPEHVAARRHSDPVTIEPARAPQEAR